LHRATVSQKNYMNLSILTSMQTTAGVHCARHKKAFFSTG